MSDVKPSAPARWRRRLRWPGRLLFGLAVWVYAFWVTPAVVVPLWHAWHDREMRVLEKQGGSVQAVQLSPDGKTLYSLSRRDDERPGFLKVWDVDSGRLLREQEADWTMTLSRDGKLLAAGSMRRGVVQFWDTDTWQLLREVDTRLNHLGQMALSPDNRLLALGGLTPRQRGQEEESVAALSVWEVATGKRLMRLQGHHDAVNGAAFSADGKWLASCSADGIVCVWDGTTGEQVVTASNPDRGSDAAMFRVAFSPDGKFLAALDSNSILIWHVGSWQPVTRLAHECRYAHALAFSPDGRLLAVGGAYERWGRLQGGQIGFWDVDGWRPRGTLWRTRGAISGLAFTPDGTWIASGSGDGGGLGLSRVP